MFELLDEEFEREFPTPSVLAQRETEKAVLELFDFYEFSLAYVTIENSAFSLDRKRHLKFLENALIDPCVGNSYDINRTWIIYWVLHSIELLGIPPPGHLVEDCQNEGGGFGGGPGHISHITATYGAILSLAILGWYNSKAYDIINRSALRGWLKKLCKDDGSLLVHLDGECDIRGIYCGIVAATLTGIDLSDCFANAANYLVSCQTYEGGLGAVPGCEAHGGYTYCGLAALVLLKSAHLLDLKSVLEWVCHRQLPVEGAFQGRTNKLVDGCYSWWQGSLLSILDMLLVNPDMYPNNSPFGDYYLNLTNNEIDDVLARFQRRFSQFLSTHSIKIKSRAEDVVSEELKSAVWDEELINLSPALPWDSWRGSWMFDQLALQKYILTCSQDFQRGGMRDKPKLNSDYYHTCYVLSGLSISQNNALYMESNPATLLNAKELQFNLLRRTDWIFNVGSEKVLNMRLYFEKGSISGGATTGDADDGWTR